MTASRSVFGFNQDLPFSEACERNKQPILDVLSQWLPATAKVLEVGSGSGQHAVHICRQLSVQWQPSEQRQNLAGLQRRVDFEGGAALPGRLLQPIPLDVTDLKQWPSGPFQAVFSANTAHIMSAPAVSELLAGSARVLDPGGLLLLYGPFLSGGVHTSASNAAFDAHLLSLDPAMGVRDAAELSDEAAALGLTALEDLDLPANNRVLIFRCDQAVSTKR
ncbi:DUF938 domain-containing protein [Synechococcus sp. CS-602]|uniref:DUF938 domain-containing protein n=1 Tax=Synechococcaceae TaxID=1890426 RepID=UPI0008FF10CE|nr:MULTISPECIES: DUF938 domain-containing protein [Synechococcaceae]APD49020.1 hypothetical protein BM449_13195 [Synechococcus sp. SynAce01]MCT0203546.1 DUF938 domain-containing protein [Synechococcus sp. CS-602]MCT0244807.1 DUF938 domain-containing protein [Synechococcus sp. CS-601]MCT4366537.1 class I SAM-dependent methyltransferase [Candidatus Regnicoccus frigidus MAG-AL2]TWB88261.1 uncharacterized protein DUF938 [Synechococcus sp. Ace-Pa]